MLHYGRGRYEEAETRFGEALRVSPAVGRQHPRGAGGSASLGASPKELQGRYGDARAHMEEAISINRARNDERRTRPCAQQPWRFAGWHTDGAPMRATYEESLASLCGWMTVSIRSINLASLGLTFTRAWRLSRGLVWFWRRRCGSRWTRKTKPRMAHVLPNSARVLHQQGATPRARGDRRGDRDARHAGRRARPDYQQLKEVRRETEWWSKGRPPTRKPRLPTLSPNWRRDQRGSLPQRSLSVSMRIVMGRSTLI
ncbi:MAG: tetratricopeptide repeat protein [Chloroflexi bacterium]|nr:tetratricopeptide repeat protein [Chloroflexota bacterium]